MKKVDFNKLQAGDLVEVPRTQFAPMRRGWNGWLFSEAVVIRKGVGRKSKKNVVVVEMRTPAGKNSYGTIEATFYAENVFTKPVVGHKFSIAASDGEKIVGVAIVGRPVSRYLDNGLTLEVNRLCTDGTRNACSFLYSAAWRAARNLGYKKLITYILVSETGSSLKAAGWKCVGECGGKRWNGRSAPKVDLYPAQMKLRFEVEKGGE